MKWDDLRAFLSVARDGTLSAAGKTLNVDTATVGRQITRLEQALGARLFERTSKGYRLAEHGEQLLDHAITMERQAEEIRARAAAPTETLAGPVRIGAPDGVAATLLADVVADIVNDHPALDFQIITIPRKADLSMREADLLIALAPPDSGRLRVRRISDYRLHLYARRDLAGQHGGLRLLDDLKSVTIIGYVSDLIQDPALDYMPLIGPDLKPRLCSTSLNVQLSWARSGAGVCVFPDFMASRWPELVRVLDDEISFTRSFYLIQQDDSRAVPRLARTASMIAAGLRTRLAVAPPGRDVDYPADVGH